MSETNSPTAEQTEPYLHGNPWIVVLVLSLTPICFICGMLGGFPGGVLFVLLGFLAEVPTAVFAIITRKKTQWTLPSAIVSSLLAIVHFGFIWTFASYYFN